MDKEATFTYSIKSNGEETLVVRTDDKQPLLELRRELKGIIVKGQKTERPKMNIGDDCPNCDGVLQERTAKNRDNGKPYSFLGCSQFPQCDFTAYQK